MPGITARSLQKVGLTPHRKSRRWPQCGRVARLPGLALQIGNIEADFGAFAHRGRQSGKIHGVVERPFAAANLRQPEGQSGSCRIAGVGRQQRPGLGVAALFERAVYGLEE